MQSSSTTKRSKWFGLGGLLVVCGGLAFTFLLVGFVLSFGFRRYFYSYCGVRSKAAVMDSRSHKVCQDRLLKLGKAYSSQKTIVTPAGFSEEDLRCPVSRIGYFSFYVDDKRFFSYCPGHHWENEFVYYSSSDSQIHSDAPEADWSQQLLSSYLWKSINPRKALDLAIKASQGTEDFPSDALFQTAQLASQLGEMDLVRQNEAKLDTLVQMPIARCQRIASLAVLGRQSEARELANSLTSHPDVGELAKVLLADLDLEDGRFEEAERGYREARWDNAGEAWVALIRKKPELAHRLSCEHLQKRNFEISQSQEWLRIAILTGRFLGGNAEEASKKWLAIALEKSPRDENYSGLLFFNEELSAEDYLKRMKSPADLNVAEFNIGAWLAAQHRRELAKKHLEKVNLAFTYERLAAKAFLP